MSIKHTSIFNLQQVFTMLFFIVSVIFLSGCTSSNPGNVKKDKILLRWSAYGYEAYDKFRYEYSKKFEEIHPEVEVKYEPITTAYGDKILNQLATDTIADVFLIPPGWLPYLARKGVFLDLTPYIVKDSGYFDQIYKPLMKGQEYNGSIYALPSNCNTDVLFYNRKMFKESAVAEPDENWDWQMLLEAAMKLTKKDDSGRIKQFGLLPEYEWNYVFQNGGRVWNSARTRCVVNNKETIEAFQFLSDLKHKYRVIPVAREFEQSDAIGIFSGGRAAMFAGGRWLTAAFKIKKKTVLDWSIAPIPKGKNGRTCLLTFNSLGIWSKTNHPDLSFELLKFMIGPGSIKFLIGIGDSQPIRRQGEEVEMFLNESGSEGKNQIYLDAMEHAYLIDQIYNPSIPHDMQSAAMMRALDKINFSPESVKIELAKLENELNKILAAEKAAESK